MFLHITAVEYLEDYRLKLKFNNGAEGVVDLEKELYGEVFEPLRDKKLFKQVFLTTRTIEWPNGADFAPEFLLEVAELQPVAYPAPKKEEATPKLKEVTSNPIIEHAPVIQPSIPKGAKPK